MKSTITYTLYMHVCAPRHVRDDKIRIALIYNVSKSSSCRHIVVVSGRMSNEMCFSPGFVSF